MNKTFSISKDYSYNVVRGSSDELCCVPGQYTLSELFLPT